MKRTEPNRPSDREAIEATAAAWLAERGGDGGLTPARAEEFARWRAADLRHEIAVARLEATWAALQPLRALRPGGPERRRRPDPDLLAPARAPRHAGRFRAVAAVALAASLALAAVWWVGRDTDAGSPPRIHHYATTINAYEQVTLEDGSVLELNADSAVAVSFTPGERRVRLIRGEAHFTVVKDKARPFEVEAGTVAVRAVGTAFAVRVGSSDVEVLVTEGKIAVAKIVGPALAAVPSRREPASEGGLPISGSPTFVSAHERTLIPLAPPLALPAPPVVEKITPEAVREALAWREQRLLFEDTPLAEVVAQFNRRNAVQIELADTELAALPVGGSFRADHVDTFVRLLTADNDIAAERPEPGRIVLRKR